MAITVTNRHATNQSADATTYNWSLTSLTASRWLVIDVFTQRTAGGDPQIPALSGGSLSYTQDETIVVFARRLTRFHAWNPDQTSFTLTTNLTDTNVGAICHVQEIDGADLTDPFVTGNSLTSSGSGTSGSVTLGAYAHADNRFLFAIGNLVAEAFTEEHTQLSDTNQFNGSNNHGMSVSWHATTQDIAPSATWTTSGNWVAIASEIKALAASTVAMNVGFVNVGF